MDYEQIRALIQEEIVRGTPTLVQDEGGDGLGSYRYIGHPRVGDEVDTKDGFKRVRNVIFYRGIPGRDVDPSITLEVE
jgi:hypothetical protein